MPEISRFFGIVIRMFAEAGERHSKPHFHASYQEHDAVYDLDSITRLDGSLPMRQERLVVAWAEIHRDELRGNWNALRSGHHPAKIEPLR
jgi:hypothetical protein